MSAPRRFAPFPLCPWLALTGFLLAAPLRSEDTDTPPITSFEDVWQIKLPPQSQQPHPVRLEAVVYYHDAVWKSMWARCGNTTSFIGFSDIVPPTQPGQRILIEGTVRPEKGMQIEAAKITVLAEAVPMETVDARGQMDHIDLLHSRMVSLEGLVERQVDSDPSHLIIELVVEGRLVTAWMPHPIDRPVPQMEGAFVRATGVFCATANPSGQTTKLELCVQGPEAIAVTTWLERDARFAGPPLPIHELATAKPDRLVYVTGTARAQQPGRSLTIRDDTGQVTVLTQQARPVQLGERVEAIGYARTDGNDFQLTGGLYRRAVGDASTAVRGLPLLRLAGQLLDLPVDAAANGYPIHLNGVVTWSHPQSEFFFLTDSSGGIRVRRPQDSSAPPLIGSKTEVLGLSNSGDFAPIVQATTLHTYGSLTLPEPRPITLEQALTGIEDAQWVSLSGYVRDIVLEGPWTRLELSTSAGTFIAQLPRNAQLSSLRGSVLRVSGVCCAVANDKRQLQAVQIWVPDSAHLEVEEAAPTDLFAVPARTIASLRQFGTLKSFNRRVRLSGLVVGQVPGRLLHVQEGTDALLVLSRDTQPLVPGDRIEVVGFPSRESSRVVLHEALYRKIEPGPEPAPLLLAAMLPVDPEADGRLVRVEGRVLEISAQEMGPRLIVQSPAGLFEARLDLPQTEVAPAWQPGSRIALTGVYDVQFDEFKRPASARLLLRTPRDVQVLSRPPWWTTRRALGASGILGIGTVLGFAWVVALRRRVRLQTGLIREQFEKEKAARLEATLVRTSKLESLGLLAGGIAHDFNNLLTVVIGNLSLVRLDRKLESDTALCITESTRASLRARDLTQQLLTFAKGGNPVRIAVPLQEFIRESAEFALHGSTVRCHYDIAADLWPGEVDKAQIGQVVHNLVLNATQSMPSGGMVTIVLRNTRLAAGIVGGLPAGRYLEMTVGDQGIGIGPEQLSRIFEPYFTTKLQGNGLGLATVHSVIRKHQGHIEVASSLGRGTTFRLWIPAADRLAPAIDNAGPPARPAAFSGRILFMDDEAPIRQMATMLFKRLDLDVTTVEDGSAVLREYAAAREAARPYSAVILDLTVPGGMGGAEAMVGLRELDPQVCAIVSSGYSSDPVLAEYRAYGFRAIMRKPYEVEDVVQILAKHLPAK